MLRRQAVHPPIALCLVLALLHCTMLQRLLTCREPLREVAQSSPPKALIVHVSGADERHALE